MVTTITERAVNPVSRTEAKLLWESHDWSGIEKQVRRLQNRIYCAAKLKQWKRVRNLQNLLAKSYNNKLLAIRRVTQLNRGKNTPGIDKELILTDSKRFLLSLETFDYRVFYPKPVRRVYILKKTGKKRPLGIPTIRDRVMQSIVKACLEPEWEARFDPNSYGFRPGYSTMDAVKQIWYTLHWKNSSEWVLDADISGCFDNISHEAVLKRIPVFKQIIGRWLKAGVIEFGIPMKTDKGTPQGGIISPLLANIVLDGLESLFGIVTNNENYISPGRRGGLNKGVSLIRYADDFIITAPSPDILINYVIPKVTEFLGARGLSLNHEKTRIMHRSAGFNFLGFYFKYFTPKSKKAVLLVTPSKENRKKLTKNLKDIIKTSHHETADQLINRLNFVIRGWVYYFRYVNSNDTFNSVKSELFRKMWGWTKRKHPKKNATWRKNKYFRTIGNRNWVFSGITSTLFNPALVPIRSFVKVKRYASIYDQVLTEYWVSRFSGNRFIPLNNI